jgi:hypothetical protein
MQGFQLTPADFLLRYLGVHSPFYFPIFNSMAFGSLELNMKMIAAVPFALLTLGMLGCSEHASTAPVVARPAPAASETNTFGESKDEAAGSAASARAANYGADSAAPK